MTKFEEAHLRMVASLRVRTHFANPKPRRPLKRFDLQKHAGASRPVTIRGKTYPSLTMARKELRIGITTLYRMIDRGEAVYA